MFIEHTFVLQSIYGKIFNGIHNPANTNVKCNTQLGNVNIFKESSQR